MTDSFLMDADCIHGNVWFECDECTKDINDYFSKLEESENTNG
jgi:hypothetical protein